MIIQNRIPLIGHILRRCHQQAMKINARKYNLTAYFGKWPETEQKEFRQHMRIIADFISEPEEQQLHEEIEPYMSRLRYEFDHWDDAIHGFRETERKKWFPKNREVLERVRQVAFDGAIMPYVHILDLAPDGVIKPHVDSTRVSPEAPLKNNFYADILLPRRSLYIMSHTARYNFTHEILSKEHSQFRGTLVPKTRRISIICRNEP
ncbi:alpha-ketoglutarate-dependent dioxygenase alkB homolog 7, mitochondrial [Drosophila yakuba]|uniref:Alpha-ketoglutarate-dependent dioxygenase AlkB-like domain-containing protein n=1 Tax=Drosophila yakuba TaxID=7245 RepID=B4PFQ8_DROYA|nr:alpha-ketoglutarate-dependent dioxygenase alkB homolog 7, mitochondrial [Drosophila yakuba]EDW94207.1 uncharacterized protein Dyak_GE20172 [Drosophila yakuba]